MERRNEYKTKNGYTIEIRVLRRDDLEQIQILLQYWLNTATRKRYDSEIAEDLKLMRSSLLAGSVAHYFVAVRDDKILGTLGYIPLAISLIRFARTNKAVQLINVYVQPEMIGRGIGSALLHFVENQIRKHYHEIVVVSSERFQQRGWPFYEKHGYISLDSFHRTDRLLCRVYQKTLNKNNLQMLS